MMKRFLLLICISIVSQVAVAQWHYSVSATTNGCGYLDKSVAEAQVKYWMGEGYKTFSNKNECEQSRMFVMSQSYTDGSCRVKYIASPCTGSVGSSGNTSAFNSTNGSSFYSTNPINEINDWSNDDMERMLALNPEYKPKESNTISTGDIAFDNLIENIPYSDEAFSGRMPRGSTHIMTDGNITAIGQPVKGKGVLVPDDFTSRPFKGLGAWSSDDLKSVELPQGTFRLYGDVNNSERKESITDKVKSALTSLDEKLDWYNSEDGNVFQYMYTRWGKENVMAGVDLWERHHVGERISNVWNKVKEVASDPLGAWEKKREEMLDGINENKDEHIGSGILFLLKPQNQVAGENAQDTYRTLKGSLKFVFEDISKSPNYAASGKVPDYMKTIEKVGDDVSGLAGRVTERSAGLPNLSKISKPITDVYRQPREKQGKEIANITSKQIKKQTKSAVKKSEFYKSAKGKFTNLLDPNHLVTE